MFPKDTIVRPGARISLSSRITGLTPSHAGEVEWAVIGETRDVHLINKVVEEKREERINGIKSEIGQLEQRLALTRVSAMAARPVSSSVSTATQEDEVEEIEETPEVNLAAAITSIDSGEDVGFWERFKKFFLRTR